MRLSHKFKPKLSHKEKEIINELAWHTTKFYNIVNYQIKNNDDIRPVYSPLDKEFKSNWHCNFLMAHNRQHCLKQLAKDWKSYFKSIKEYKNNPNKYKGKPRPPKFKKMHKKPNEVIFTNEVARVQGDKGDKLVLSLQKGIKDKYQVQNLKFELPKAIQSLIHSDNAKIPKSHSVKNTLQQVKIKYDKVSNECYFLITYKQEPKKKTKGNNIMSIDLGLDNLATITYKDNVDSQIINGKPLKSKNSYFNKEITRLQQIRMKQTSSKHFKDTKEIKKLRTKRKNYVMDYIHKASRKVIDLAKKHKVSKIIIGDLKEIKQDMDYNKSFVQIPIQKFKDLIKYKAKLEGIETIIINEAFTSGCSALDLEKLNRNNYDKTRRITRGLFKSNEGVKINADVNGSLNIMRKYLKDKCIPSAIWSDMKSIS